MAIYGNEEPNGNEEAPVAVPLPAPDLKAAPSDWNKVEPIRVAPKSLVSETGFLRPPKGEGAAIIAAAFERNPESRLLRVLAGVEPL